MIAKSKKWMGFLIMVSILLFLSTGLTHAQLVYEDTLHNWVHYTSGGRYNEVECGWWDNQIYGAGTGTNYSHFIVRSLTQTGDVNWVFQYSTSLWRKNEANALICGWDQYIYAAGFSCLSGSNKDMIVIKIDPNTGDSVWTYRYNGSQDRNDEALAIDFGADNHIYVAGYSEHASGNKDFMVIKLDLLGNEIGVYEYNGPGDSDDEAKTIKAPQGGMGGLAVYVGGYHTDSVNGKDFVVAKLDTHLTVQWFDVIDGDAHGDDECHTLNKDYLPDVYAGGYLTNSGTGKDFVFMEYDRETGDPEWTYSYDGPGNADDECNAVSIGRWGMMGAVGYSTDTIGGGGMDYTVICFNLSAEDTIYTYRYNGPGNRDDEALSVAYYESDVWDDCFFVGGYSSDTIGGGSTDITVSKHGSYYQDDRVRWIYRHGYEVIGVNDQGRSVDCQLGGAFVGGMTKFHIDATWQGKIIGLPDYFPPTTTELIYPADSGFVNDTVVTLKWHASESAEHGTIYYLVETSYDDYFATPDSFWASDTSYTATLTDTIYYWRVKCAEYSIGGLSHYSGWSDDWRFSFDLTPPETPALLNPISDVFVFDTTVTFDWSPVMFREFPTLIHYVLQVDTVDALTSPIIEDTFLVDTADYNLAVDDRYYWRVKAYDLAANESPYSDVESFRLDITPPLIDSTTVWNDTSFTGPFDIYTKTSDFFGIDSVRLYFKRVKENPAWFYYNMIGDPVYYEQIPEVTYANDSVHYYIWVKDNAGRISTDPSGAPADYYAFIADYDPGVEEFDTPTVFSFGLKSNPVKNKAMFNMSLPEAATITLRIYDVTGRLVDKLISGQKSAGYYEIPWIPRSTAGVYFYKFESLWKTSVGKFVLVR